MLNPMDILVWQVYDLIEQVEVKHNKCLHELAPTLDSFITDSIDIKSKGGLHLSISELNTYLNS